MPKVYVVELSAHSHFHVRGNAILGFSHIAQRFGYLDREIVQPIIQASPLDEVEYVRGQAIATMDDTAFLLGWDGWTKELEAAMDHGSNPARLLLDRCMAKHVVRLLLCHGFAAPERPSRPRANPATIRRCAC
jgi:hypothetical protein